MMHTYLLCSTQTVEISVGTTGGDDVVFLNVRPWYDLVQDLQSQAFGSEAPSHRQQLLLDGKRMKEDGRVLAQHGVLAGSAVILVSYSGQCFEWYRYK